MDAEVRRLRRLRASALRVRAIARSLACTRALNQDPMLARARCAAWRVARAATGHLRGHPYMGYQRDAGVATVLFNGFAAAAAALQAVNRAVALSLFEAQLTAFSRELDDARALTWASHLSDTFGRSQAEIRGLLAACTSLRARDRPLPATSIASAPQRVRVAETDWPYLAF